MIAQFDVQNVTSATDSQKLFNFVLSSFLNGASDTVPLVFYYSARNILDNHFNEAPWGKNSVVSIP